MNLTSATPREQEFLTKLANLLDEYEASLIYTTHDDGIHVVVRGAEVFAGFMDTPSQLRAAVEAQRRIHATAAGAGR